LDALHLRSVFLPRDGRGLAAERQLTLVSAREAC